MTLEDNGRKWKGVFEQFAASGISRREFCRREGISLSTFGYWKKKFRNFDHVGAVGRAATKVPVRTPFIELATIGTIAPNLRGDELELKFPSGISLRAGARISMRTLLQLTRILSC